MPEYDDALLAKAAEAIDRHYANRITFNGEPRRFACACGWWDKDDDTFANHQRHIARAVLDAVAPLIAAQALRDAADEVHREARWIAEQTMRGHKPHPLDCMLVLEKVLLDRADRIAPDPARTHRNGHESDEQAGNASVDPGELHGLSAGNFTEGL